MPESGHIPRMILALPWIKSDIIIIIMIIIIIIIIIVQYLSDYSILTFITFNTNRLVLPGTLLTAWFDFVIVVTWFGTVSNIFLAFT